MLAAAAEGGFSTGSVCSVKKKQKNSVGRTAPNKERGPAHAAADVHRGHVRVLKAALSHTLVACFGDGCPNTAPLYTLGRLRVFSTVAGRLKIAARRPVLNKDEVIFFFCCFFLSMRGIFFFHVHSMFCPTELQP